eukprot:4341769-Pyramimonas_sp.AAC.1
MRPRATVSVGLTYHGEETRLKANPSSTFATDYANHTDCRWGPAMPLRHLQLHATLMNATPRHHSSRAQGRGTYSTTTT